MWYWGRPTLKWFWIPRTRNCDSLWIDFFSAPVVCRILRVSHPGFKPAAVKTSFGETLSVWIKAVWNRRSSLLSPPCMQTGYKLSHLRKSPFPPPTSFYLPIGRWMLEIRIPGETWDGENRNKDVPMSGSDVSLSSAFPFIPRAPVKQRQGEREHI